MRAARKSFFFFVPAAAAAAGLLLAGILGEAYCRVKELGGLGAFHHHGYPKSEIFAQSNFLPFELAPNLPGFSNSLGMRDKERSIKKAPGVFRIAVLGDSITMYGTYTDRLEELLRAQGYRVEVWNCSIGGHGIADYYHNLKRRVLGYKPDLVLIGFCLNDFQLTPVMFKGVDGRMHCYRALRLFKGNWDNLLFRRSNLYRLLLLRLEARRAARRMMDEETVGRVYLGKIQELCRGRGIPLMTMVFPYFRPDSEQALEYRTMKRVLAGQGVDCLDLHEVFKPGERRRYLWPTQPDDVHPNDAAHRIVARVLARRLLKSGVLSRGSPAR